MHRFIQAAAAAALLFSSAQSAAEEYVIDTQGAHAFIQFRIMHLGYSWLWGRFDRFSGRFSYDEDHPAASSVKVVIDTASVDSNHAERDKHLRSGKFLQTGEYPRATFVSTAFRELGGGKAVLEGNLTLLGETRPITIDVQHVGHGLDPWGGYRRGFEGRTRFALADFGMVFDLGAKSKEVELLLSIEGIRQ